MLPHIQPVLEDDGGTSAADAGTPPPPPSGNLVYNGGPVISNVKIYQVLYGTGPYAPEIRGSAMGNFYSQVTQSSYLDWLSEYDTDRKYDTGGLFAKRGAGTDEQIVHGSYGGQITITPSSANDGDTIDNSQIQAELGAQIASGNLPAPDSNTMYMVNFPSGKAISLAFYRSCVKGGFCAYHDSFKQGDQAVYYGVLPDMGPDSGCWKGCGTGSAFDKDTTVASHELIEAMTDAEVGAAFIGGGPPLGWYDAQNGEVGDICVGRETSFVGTDGVSYAVQKGWSNVNHACISAPVDSAPNDFFISAGSSAISLSVHGTTTVNVSTSVLAGSPEQLTLSVSGLPWGVSGKFDPPTISAGESSVLTLSADGWFVWQGNSKPQVQAQGASATRSSSFDLAVGSIGFDNIPASQTVEATSAAGAVAFWADPTAVMGTTSLPVSCQPTSGSLFPLGATKVTCSAQNGGTTGTATFTVTVRDTTGPAITVPASLTAEATAPNGGLVSYAPTATDSVDGDRPVTCTPASGSLLPLGTTSVMCSSQDSRGNPSQATFSVLVRDTTAPSLTCPKDVEQSQGGAITYPPAAASDAVSGVTLSYSIPSGTSFDPGRTTVRVTATDQAGNQATCSFSVTIGSPNASGSAHGCSAGGVGGWAELMLIALSLGWASSRRRAIG